MPQFFHKVLEELIVPTPQKYQQPPIGICLIKSPNDHKQIHHAS